MEAQDLINLLFSLVGAGMGYYISSMNRAISMLSDKVQHIEVLVAGAYPTRVEFEKLADKIYGMLEKIDVKLDGKVDK